MPLEVKNFVSENSVTWGVVMLKHLFVCNVGISPSVKKQIRIYMILDLLIQAFDGRGLIAKWGVAPSFCLLVTGSYSKRSRLVFSIVTEWCLSSKCSLPSRTDDDLWSKKLELGKRMFPIKRHTKLNIKRNGISLLHCFILTNSQNTTSVIADTKIT